MYTCINLVIIHIHNLYMYYYMYSTCAFDFVSVQYHEFMTATIIKYSITSLPAILHVTTETYIVYIAYIFRV